MGKFLLAVTALLTCIPLFAGDGNGTRKAFSFSGYQGGMMVHSGYVRSGQCQFVSADGAQTYGMVMQGAPLGIGGALKLGFGEHLRVGAEGYVSNLYYGRYGSYSSTGWGGVLADCVWHKGRWSWFAGGTIGGGGVKNVTLFDDMPLDFRLENGTASYRHYGFMAIVPYAGVEFALTGRVHLTMKVDWMLNVTRRQADFVTGPRIYLGFMFCHSKLD